jgi:hypothetical protein
MLEEMIQKLNKKHDVYYTHLMKMSEKIKLQIKDLKQEALTFHLKIIHRLYFNLETLKTTADIYF